MKILIDQIRAQTGRLQLLEFNDSLFKFFFFLSSLDESNTARTVESGRPQLMEGRADVGHIGLGPLLVGDSSVTTESGRCTKS